MQARIVSLNLGPGGIPKQQVELARVTLTGLAGDGHNHAKHNTPQQAISLIDLEDLLALQSEGFAVVPGATGENITTEGLQVDSLQVGDRLRFPSGVELELTKRRKPCYVLDAIDPALKDVIVGRCGFLARVLVPGELRVGDVVTVETAVTAEA